MAEYFSDEEYVTENDYLKRAGHYEGERNELEERHGNGKATYGNGDEYKGEFKHGMRHGEGKYKFNNARYTGSYEKGKRNGVGTMIYPDGSKYAGSWKDGKRHGQGEYTFGNGDKFVGEFENDVRHGHGVYHYAETGSKFSAKWNEGQQDGQGKLTHADHVYEGNFQDCIPCGRGKYSFDTCCEQHGYYVFKNILRKVDNRVELVGREPKWHSVMLAHSIGKKDS